MDLSRRNAFAFVAALALAGAPAFAGCKGDAEEPGGEDTVGEEVEEAAEDTGDAVEDAADEVEDEVDEAAD